MTQWLQGGDGAPSDFEVWGTTEKKHGNYSREALDEWISGTLKRAQKEKQDQEKEEKKKTHKKKL
jgi:hypothetical protein